MARQRDRCLADPCDVIGQYRGLCPRHRHYWERDGQMMPMKRATARSRAISPRASAVYRKPCIVEQCESVAQYRGLCQGHRATWESAGVMVPMRPPTRRSGVTLQCQAPACVSEALTKGFCKPHYDSVVVRGASPGSRIRELHPRVEGDLYRWANGYVSVYLPDHPNALSNGYYPQHRQVMEQVVGRYLLESEQVHHRNGVRDDNRPENLELWAKTQPAGQRVVDLLAWAREIETLYGELADQGILAAAT